VASVLVAYATKYGSTKEVAEAIAKALGERGVDAVMRPPGVVRDLKGYSAAVLGTTLCFFRWRGEAHRFISRNRSTLSGVPVAVFGLGPIEDTPERPTLGLFLAFVRSRPLTRQYVAQYVECVRTY